MATDYAYQNVSVDPDYFGRVKPDVESSAMTDKSIEGHIWYDVDAGVAAHLLLRFTNELSAGDKIILDGIVAAL